MAAFVCYFLLTEIDQDRGTLFMEKIFIKCLLVILLLIKKLQHSLHLFKELQTCGGGGGWGEVLSLTLKPNNVRTE